MPNMDGTGPQGIGAMTGRGFGNGLVGYRRQATLTKEEEKKILEAKLKELDLEKQDIEKRLKEIK